MKKGKRVILPEDRALFWQALTSGVTLREAARIGGISYNTALQWRAKAKSTKAEKEIADLEGTKPQGGHGALNRDNMIMRDMPPVIPSGRLSPRAAQGLVDFDHFRRVYLGRVPSPWQVEAAYKIVEHLEHPDKQFMVLNVPPGAGKSTLFHDVAVWAIVRNRSIRVLIGSASQRLAKQYSDRIRHTLERTTPIRPHPDVVKRGLAVNAEGCLAQDYGRFKPTALGSLWRADEFIVDQLTGGGLDNKEPTVSAYGIDSEFIGHRADLCLFDDVANSKNSKESVSRDKLLETWDSVAEARCDPGGLLAVIGQRLGPLDLYAHCLSQITYEDIDEDDESDGSVKTHKYHHVKYKAYYEDRDTGPKSLRRTAPAYPAGPLLEPYRVPWSDLAFNKTNKPDIFNTVYQQEDKLAGTYLIDRVWATGGMGEDGIMYPGCIDIGRKSGTIPRGLTPPIISIASVDPSPTQFWAVEWWLYQPETNLRYLVDLERCKLTAEELLGYDTGTREFSGIMERWQSRSFEMGYPISHWIVEINAAQRFLLAHDFVRKWQALQTVSIVPHTTSKNKLDETLGVEALLPPLWRTGQVRLPDMRGQWQTMAFVEEMATWSRGKKHGTDCVMSHWFAELHMPNIVPMKPPPRLWRPSWLNA